jgi:hypothetical protein
MVVGQTIGFCRLAFTALQKAPVKTGAQVDNLPHGVSFLTC